MRRTRAAALGVGGLLWALASVPAPAGASPPPAGWQRRQAERDAAEGRRLLRDGQFDEALFKLKSAYAAEPSAETLLDIAEAQRGGGRILEAYASYETLLHDHAVELSVEQRQAVQGALAELNGKTGTLKLAIDPSANVAVDGDMVPASARGKPIRLLIGAHRVAVTKTGAAAAIYDVIIHRGKEAEVPPPAAGALAAVRPPPPPAAAPILPAAGVAPISPAAARVPSAAAAPIPSAAAAPIAPAAAAPIPSAAAAPIAPAAAAPIPSAAAAPIPSAAAAPIPSAAAAPIAPAAVTPVRAAAPVPSAAGAPIGPAAPVPPAAPASAPPAPAPVAAVAAPVTPVAPAPPAVAPPPPVSPASAAGGPLSPAPPSAPATPPAVEPLPAIPAPIPEESAPPPVFAPAEAAPTAAPPAAQDPLRVGVMVGLLSFPRPLEAELVFKLGRWFGLGVEASFLPQVSVPAIDGKLNLKAIQGLFRWHVFGNAFYLGGGLGYQNFQASLGETIDNGELKINADMSGPFVIPQLGWMWIFDSGFAMGLSFGIQIPIPKEPVVTATYNGQPVPSQASSTVPQDAVNEAQTTGDNVRSAAKLIVRYPFPQIDFLRLGFFF